MYIYMYIYIYIQIYIHIKHVSHDAILIEKLDLFL